MNTRTTILGGAIIALALPLTNVALARAGDGDDQRLDLVAGIAATEPYQDIDAAIADGWQLPPDGPLHECISEHEGHGSMGFHYINGVNAGDAVPDPERPAALVYEPTVDGGLRLVAAEYVVFAEAWDAEHPDESPELFGRELTYVAEPNRYELPAFYQIHAWMWKVNPDGTFADFNATVSCDPA